VHSKFALWIIKNYKKVYVYVVRAWYKVNMDTLYIMDTIKFIINNSSKTTLVHL